MPMPMPKPYPHTRTLSARSLPLNDAIRSVVSPLRAFRTCASEPTAKTKASRASAVWQCRSQCQRQRQSRSRASSVRIARMAMNETRFSTEKVVDSCSCRMRYAALSSVVPCSNAHQITHRDSRVHKCRRVILPLRHYKHSMRCSGIQNRRTH